VSRNGSAGERERTTYFQQDLQQHPASGKVSLAGQEPENWPKWVCDQVLHVSSSCPKLTHYPMEGLVTVFPGKAEAKGGGICKEKLEKLHAKIVQLVVERDFLAKASAR
jgi:hypothetical protein